MWFFSNPAGMDADQLKNNCPMIIDSFGDYFINTS